MCCAAILRRGLFSALSTDWCWLGRVASLLLPHPGNYHAETGMPGWGGRIRTSAWRNQNPLPYHLATPHCESEIARHHSDLRAGRQRLAASQACRYKRRRFHRSVAQPGSAPASGAGGRWFESTHSDQLRQAREAMATRASFFMTWLRSSTMPPGTPRLQAPPSPGRPRRREGDRSTAPLPRMHPTPCP